MNRQRFEQRREKLRALMRKEGLTALVVTLDANRFYLSGFELHDAQINESSGCIVVTDSGKDWLCTDSRYLDAARRLWDAECIFIYRGNAMDQINLLLHERVKGTIGFEALNISLDQYERLSRQLDMKRADGMVESLRVIKDEEEIKCMARACELNHKMMQWLPGVLVPGRSEGQIAWDIEQFFRNHGAEELAFASIVAVDANAALPHAEPGPALVKDNCCVLVDVGCRLDRYCSDQTRTFWVGERVDSDFARDLELVQEAQARAIKKIAPGVSTAEVYAAARSFLDGKGVGDLFTHGLGHGIGLQTHEGPSLNSVSSSILKPGMVVTVEPGLYRPGMRGIRWEYMVLVTEEGARVL